MSEASGNQGHRELVTRLEGDNVQLLLMEWVNPAGLAHGKVIPLRRVPASIESGLGGAPVFHVFCIDGSIAFTDSITAVGDLRMVLDPASVRPMGAGWAWGAGSFVDQDGVPDPACSRQVLTRVQTELADEGIEALVGHELEFVVVNPDGSAPTGPWVPYGVTGVLDFEFFIDELFAAATTSGLAIEQFHAEYGAHQFELSLQPAAPVAAADALVLARTLVSRVLRAHGLAASFSPVPFAGAVGNGAHQHFSLTREGHPLFADGDGPRGVTAEGAAAIGGLLVALPDIQGLLTGSILSGARLQPGGWAGAFACWGTENREAAVRFILGGRANPLGANVEVKSIDPSANPYLATAAILAACLDGIRHSADLPEEVTMDPSKATATQREELAIVQLSDDPAVIIDRLDSSPTARGLLGDACIDATVAVRRQEQRTLAALSPQAQTDMLRLAWSS